MCYVMMEKQKEQRENRRRKPQTKRGFQQHQSKYGSTQRFGQMANPLHQNMPVFGEFGTITQPVIQRQEYPKTQLFHNLYNEIMKAWFCIFDRRQLIKLLEKILGTEVDAESEESENKICDIYYQDEKKKEEFFEYIRQIMATCQAYKELLYIKYPPNKYKIEGDTIVCRANPATTLSFVEFVQQNIHLRENHNNYSNFNPSICKEYEEFIVDFIRLKRTVYDSFYESNDMPQYIQSEYTLDAQNKINSVVENSNYCVYRSMPKQQVVKLEEYFAKKDQIEGMIRDAGMEIAGFVSDITRKSDRQSEVSQLVKKIKQLCPDVPVTGHLGNLTQALTYGGVLVKFYIKKGEARNLTGTYLAEGGKATSGSQGSTTNNRIGVKRENSGGGKFSYNLGDKYWVAVLFLSTVERYEVFDLRKKEDSQTRERDLRFDMVPYKIPSV